jgi:hypothetical protein
MGFPNPTLVCLQNVKVTLKRGALKLSAGPASTLQLDGPSAHGSVFWMEHVGE